MAALLQRGQRRGFSMKGEVDNGEMQLPDLRHVTVLPKAEWLRIRGSSTSNQYNNQKESTRDAAQQREAMHLCSKEMVKFWSNTISGQRQKKLEAKKIREAIEEEQRKLTDIEEAKYQAQKRKEAIAKAKAQQYYQTDRVKRFHSALLLTEVLKERDAQVELKQRIQNNSKDVDKEFMARIKSQEDEALKVEQQKTLQNRLERQAVAEDLKHQMKEHELVREREKLEDKKEGEEIHQLRKLYLWEQSMEKQSQLQQKRNIMQSHLEHLSSKDIIKAIDAQKQEMEDEQRKCFVAAKQKIMQLRRNKEAELFREAQMLRDKIIDKLTAIKQEQVIDEGQLIAKAIAEREAKQAQKQKEGDDTKAAMLKSITAHRELMRQEKEKKNLAEQQNSLDILQARKEADRLFFEKQQLKAQKKIEGERILQGHYVNQMAEKCAMGRKLRTEQQEFEAKNTDVVVEEEIQFRQYAKHVIKTAAEAKRNVLPLHKAAREGIGGGLGPIFGGVRPSYLVHDVTGVEMPTYICGTTQIIKDLHETSDIHEAKKRLGFTW